MVFQMSNTQIPVTFIAIVHVQSKNIKYFSIIDNIIRLQEENFMMLTKESEVTLYNTAVIPSKHTK